MTEQQIELEAALYLLKDFLEDQKRLRDKGITLETIHHDLEQSTRRLNERQRDLEQKHYETVLRQDRHGRRLKKLEERVLTAEEGSLDPDTGVHRLMDAKNAEDFIRMKVLIEEQQKEIEREKKEKNDEERWWRRQRWLWSIAAFAYILSMAATYYLARKP